MSAITFELEADVRNDIGKGASRRLRHADKLPAVLYGAGEAAVSLTLDHNKTMQFLAHEAVYSHILTLKMGKKAEKVILKSLQRHPVKPRLVHIDFLRVKADQKLHMNVPLHFTGGDVAPGVKEGGVISHLINDVEVSCFPADLPESITLDISQLALDQTLHLTDLKLPKGVELVAFAHGVEGHDLPVVSVHIPREIVEEAASIEATSEEGAAPEGESAESGASDEGESEDKK